jgi:hypothetical protein
MRFPSRQGFKLRGGPLAGQHVGFSCNENLPHSIVLDYLPDQIPPTLSVAPAADPELLPEPLCIRRARYVLHYDPRSGSAFYAFADELR